METKTAVNYDNVLAHVAANAKSATSANFSAIAAGTMAYLVGFTWAAEKKPAADIKADILRCFEESGDKKSKRYEFAGLCLSIARDLGKGHDWGNELRQQDSVESGVDFLAARFHSVASNVSNLAGVFGTARSAGQKKQKGFMESLESILDKAAKEGEVIPVGSAMVHLLAVDMPSANDANVIVAKLIKDWDSESLSHLMGHINDMIVSRTAKESAVEGMEAEKIAA